MNSLTGQSVAVAFSPISPLLRSHLIETPMLLALQQVSKIDSMHDAPYLEEVNNAKRIPIKHAW